MEAATVLMRYEVDATALERTTELMQRALELARELDETLIALRQQTERAFPLHVTTSFEALEGA